MKDVFETGEPEPFEADLFMKFGADAHIAGRAVIQYRRYARDMSHTEALSTIAEMHNVPKSQINFWFSQDPQSVQPSS